MSLRKSIYGRKAGKWLATRMTFSKLAMSYLMTLPRCPFWWFESLRMNTKPITTRVCIEGASCEKAEGHPLTSSDVLSMVGHGILMDR